MDCYLKGQGASLLEARVTIENGRITLHSRSGKARSDPPGSRGRNPDYVAAFDAIFDRLNVQSVAVERVLLDSAPALAVAEQQRLLARREDFEDGVLHEVKNRIRARMRAFGRSSDMPPNEGNQNKKIRIDTNLGDDEIIRRLRVVNAPTGDLVAPALDARLAAALNVKKLPAAELRKVRPEHIRGALNRLNAGDPAANFELSRDYDVMTGDGRKYAPKKVFGLALEEVFGINAMPGHFDAGWGTPCFDILEECGLWIVPKSGAAKRPPLTETKLAQVSEDLVPTEEEKTWVEGNPRIATHLRKERSPGLAAKKREQFIRDHGMLACEGCGLDPIKAYGEQAGSACIEVHHHRTHVSDMQPGHETSLDDLMCLCSNCHRVLHRALSLGVASHSVLRLAKPGVPATGGLAAPPIR